MRISFSPVALSIFFVWVVWTTGMVGGIALAMMIMLRKHPVPFAFAGLFLALIIIIQAIT